MVKRVIHPWIKGGDISLNELKWWGGRLAGKTVQVINLAILLALLRPDKKITFYGIRKKVENKREFYDTVIDNWPAGVKYKANVSNRVISHNNLYIEIIGLADRTRKVVQTLGKTRRQSDLTIICFDEAFEFHEKEFLSTMSAVGIGNQRMIFYCANPYDPDGAFFEKVLKRQPWTEKLAEKASEAIFYNGDKVQHFSTAEAVWNEILTDGNKALIEEAPLVDRITGEVVQKGRPLRLEGGIYTKELPYVKIIKSLADRPEMYKWDAICGIDFGYSIDPTAIVFSAISPAEDEVAVLDELEIGTKQKIFDGTEQAFKIFEFLKKNWLKYRWGGTLTIYCENDFAFVDMLNNLLHLKNAPLIKHKQGVASLNDLVEFVKVSEHYKKDIILNRVKAILRLMRTGKMSAIKGRSAKLLYEFTRSNWVENMNKQGFKFKREDKNDHFMNAFEYSLSKHWPRIGRLN